MNEGISMIKKTKLTAAEQAQILERFKPEDTEYFRELLITRRGKLLLQLSELTDSNRNTLEEYSGDHSTYSLHPADQGTNAQEREKTFLFASREGRYLKYLDRALLNLEEGTFGVCEDCHEAIQKKRLELVPTARLCVACKLKEEQKKRS